MFDHQQARSRLGRAGTVAGAAALTAAAFAPQALPVAAASVVVPTAIGVLVSIRPWREEVPGPVTALYAGPATVLLAEMAAFRIVGSGLQWPELIAEAVWAAGTWWVRPARLAVLLAGSDGAPAKTSAAIESGPAGKLTAFWARHLACDDGAAPGTRLEKVHVAGPQDFRAEIVAARGKAVPAIPLAALSALTDIPVDLITILPVPGSGTGRMALTVRPAAAPSATGTDLQSAWAAHIATKAMPGAVITRITRGSTKGDVA